LRDARTDAQKNGLASFCLAVIIRPLNMHGTNRGLPATPRKPMGWLVGLGVLLITLGVVFGLAGIAIVAKRKQAYRVNEAATENNALKPGGTNTN
jgi:hypothetical protein